jgi:hypothetical protein
MPTKPGPYSGEARGPIAGKARTKTREELGAGPTAAPRPG